MRPLRPIAVSLAVSGLGFFVVGLGLLEILSGRVTVETLLATAAGGIAGIASVGYAIYRHHINRWLGETAPGL